uniref:Col_cuticle_N domain-containing protein n=1 Tax=Panagrellus redivivus TaxID=6233 RepID=A0A7E4ZQH6_PANRE
MIHSKYSDETLRPPVKPPLKHPSKASFFLPAYGGIVGVVVSLLSLSIAVPLWMNEISRLEEEVSAELASIRSKSEASWRELLQIESDDNSVAWARIRRATNDEFSVFDYKPSTDNYYEAANLDPATYYTKQYAAQYDAPLKCCCDINAHVPLSFYDALPVSSTCPIGQKGLPGQRGPVGEPGNDGLPGRPGFNYPRQGSHFDSVPGFDPVSLYGALPPPPPRYCEPCPPGPAGRPGPKGRPGNAGMKGVRGSGGRHGMPGRSGAPGPTGDTGPRGPSGYSGVPGQKGLDGVKGSKGAPGARGQRGDTGIGGIRGPTGPQGNRGPTGPNGIRGRPGQKGQRGMDGIDGPVGPPGQPGHDAGYCKCPSRSQTFLPAIDYPRQTYGRPPSSPPSSPPASPPAQVFGRYQSNSYSQAPRPTTSTTPRPAYSHSHDSDSFTRKVYIANPGSLPVANRILTQSSAFRPTLPSPSATRAPVTSNDYDEEAFGGKEIFADTRSAAWPTDEDETYGVDAAWTNDPRQRQAARLRQLHKAHRIA